MTEKDNKEMGLNLQAMQDPTAPMQASLGGSNPLQNLLHRESSLLAPKERGEMTLSYRCPSSPSKHPSD